MKQSPATPILTGHSWENIIWNKETLSALEPVKALTGSMPWKKNPRIKGKQLPFRFLFEGGDEHLKLVAAALIGKDSRKQVNVVNLAAVASSYIGETEKSIHAVFSHINSDNNILFFDEADTLFGKKSGEDETGSALLLRLTEPFPGTIIFSLTSKANLDQAFIRRMQACVHFPV